MTKIRLPLLALLLWVPAISWANIVSIDWSAQIDPTSYGDATGTLFPTSLTDTTVSGAFTIDTSLLPPPVVDPTTGDVSVGSGSYLQSSIQWSGGLFQPEPAGSSGVANGLFFDPTQNLLTIDDSGNFVDSLGQSHSGFLQFSFSVTGLYQPVATSGVGLFGDSVVDTNGNFIDAFSANFTTESLTVSVDEPGSATSTLMLLAGMLVMIRRVRSGRPIEATSSSR